MLNYFGATKSELTLLGRHDGSEPLIGWFLLERLNFS